MRAWPEADTIRSQAREQLLWARRRRNELIAARERERAEGRSRLRNVVLTAREDYPSKFARCSARFYRLAERQLREACA